MSRRYGAWTLWGGVQGRFQLFRILEGGAEGYGVYRQIQVCRYFVVARSEGLLTLYRGMQDCFRAHPEMYGSELEDDEDEVEEELASRSQKESASSSPENGHASAPSPETTPSKTSKPAAEASEPEASAKAPKSTASFKSHEATPGLAEDREAKKDSAAHELSTYDEGEVLPKIVYDATASNQGK